MKISEILVRLEEVRERRCLAEELLNNAAVVFDDFYSLGEVKELYEKYWKALARKNLYDSGFYNKNRKEDGNIERLFDRVVGAHINREEFKELLEPFKKAVEVFIENKKSEEKELKKELVSLYDDYFSIHLSEYSFIFDSETIKQGFLEFLQS